MHRCGGDDFLDLSGEFHAQAAGVAVNAAAHMHQQFGPFCEPEDAGLAAVMAKCDNADDAVNAAISGIVCVGSVVDVVFGGDGSVRPGYVFHSFRGFIHDANAAEPVAAVGFKDGNVVRVGRNGAALNQDERMRVAAAVLHVDDAETFVGHGIRLAPGSSPDCSAGSSRNKEG